ncbi:MAG: adenosine deaminase, partial [Alphaproteobacteria bacterium]|nr:adenosine deaminase [Alphaproteobacteria bacterium]
IHGYRSFHEPKLPKDETLQKVLAGEGGADPWTEPSGKRLRLGLVGHFIKKPDKQNPAYVCRHYRLRRDLYHQRRALIAVSRHYPHLRRYLTGFDCAANELHAGPEVFAPLYRQLRFDRQDNFTYHVGEDFIHLLSGIRAVYEALTFLGLRSGNRIGHGSAIGIDPGLWREVMGRNVVMTRQDRLDDLTVVRRLLLEANGGTALLPLIDSEISILSRAIYDQSHPPDLLYEAWSLRHLDPLCLYRMGGRINIMDDALTAEFDLFDTEKTSNPAAFDLFRRYHSPETIEKGRKLAVIDSTKEKLSDELLTRLQDHVLGEIGRRGVVIETLPTSNVRISVYQNYSQHHVFRWLGLTGDSPPVDVVVGSDDPGIFSTNLRNEYEHLLRELSVKCAPPRRNPLDFLEGLITNGKTYRFRQVP